MAKTKLPDWKRCTERYSARQFFYFVFAGKITSHGKDQISYTNSTQKHCKMVLCDPESQIDFQDSLNP